MSIFSTPTYYARNSKGDFKVWYAEAHNPKDRNSACLIM